MGYEYVPDHGFKGNKVNLHKKGEAAFGQPLLRNIGIILFFQERGNVLVNQHRYQRNNHALEQIKRYHGEHHQCVQISNRGVDLGAHTHKSA